MSQYRKSEIVSGLFITLAAVVFALFAFKVGRFDLLGLFRAEAVRCRAYFLDVKTLQVGSKVTVGGRNVGEVTDLRLVEGPWPIDQSPAGRTPAGETGRTNRLVNEVTFELTYRELRLEPRTALVTIAQDSLLSPHFLRLDPGRWPAEQPPRHIFEAELPDGTVIASGEGASIDDLVAIAQPAVQDFAAILQTLNREVLTPENMKTIGRLLVRLDDTVGQGQEILAKLDRGLLAPDNVEALDRMVHNLDAALADGRAAAARLDRILDAERDPRLDHILTDAAAATRELRENLDAVSGDLRRLLGTADRVLGDTETELAEAARRLQRALWQGEMALRKIRANPAVLLFGDDETDLEARDLDMTEIRLQGRARPYEQRDEKEEP